MWQANCPLLLGNPLGLQQRGMILEDNLTLKKPLDIAQLMEPVFENAETLQARTVIRLHQFQVLAKRPGARARHKKNNTLETIKNWPPSEVAEIL